MDVEEDQEKIFMEIYTECDNNNTNSVQVSVLLSYIGPYIDSSSLHFEELKHSLDPANVNPFIDKQTFLTAMMSWTEKFKNDVDFNFNNEEISRQSTPTRNLRVDYDGLNLSSISAYSLTGSVLSAIDPNILQDQNNELQHQNKKLCECLDDVKHQLTGLEEQNVCLQNEIERINKNSQVDQKLIKTLQTKCAEYEKEREEHTRIANENKRNCENLCLMKRAKVDLENRIKELETQNKAHVEAIEKLSDLSNEKDEENEMLRKEIEERDAEILRIQEREAEWRQKCSQNELNVKNFTAETNDLKNHIQSLETLLQQNEAHQNQTQNLGSMKMDNFEPDADDSPTSDKHCKSTSPSPDDIFYEKQRESLHSELSHISTSGCFNSCEYRINQLEDEVARLYDQLKEQQELLANAKSTKEKMEEELTTARKEVNTFNSLVSEFNQLKGSLDAALKDKKQLNSKLSYYKVVHKNFKVQLENKLTELIAMRKEKETTVATFEKEMRNAEEKLEKLRQDISHRDNENKDLIEKVAGMKCTLRTVEDEVTELKQNNCKLMNEMCSLERAAKLERKRNTRVDLNCKINELEEQLEQVRSKNQHLMSTISCLTSDKQQLISKLELLENSEHGKRKVESLEAKLHKYRRKLTDLENQILSKTKEAHEVAAKHEDVSAALRTHQQDYENLMGYIGHIRTTINSNKDLLKTTTYYTSDVWKDIFGSTLPHLHISNLLNIAGAKHDVNEGPLQDEINLLNNQIHVTTILLNSFAKIKNKITIKDEKEEAEEEKMMAKKWTLNKTHNTCSCSNSSNKIDVRTLYNPHESPTANISNESFLSKLTPKRFFLKPPTLVVKSKTKTHFVFPPMSPECSLPEMQQMSIATPSASASASAQKNIEQIELNNNHTTETKQQSKNEGDKGSASASASESDATSGNSTFTKTYSDSFIQKILIEQKIDGPLAKIDQTQIFDNDISENSASASASVSDSVSTSSSSSKGDDEQNDDDDVNDEGVKKKKKDVKKKLKRERKIREEEEMIKERLTRQVRSMSEGAAVVHHLSKDGDVMVFPNLQDNALEALGLGAMAGDEPKERLTEEEIELKFQTLSLAFSIDAVTIKDRLERQQRQRDQAEDNLGTEISRFIGAVHKLHPLCVDAETTELVTSLLDRLQLIVQASHRISTSAEIFGSVQQEWRIADSVNLMLSHLRNLIKQRDAARRQLQVTKRMLQETTSPSALKKPGTAGTTRRLTINTLPGPVNGRIIGPPRRASIAVIPRPLDSPSAGVARRVAVRRTSDEQPEPSARPWDYRTTTQDRKVLTTRTPLLSRPSRLDINLELSKIQEGSTESFNSNVDDGSAEDEDDDDFQTPTLLDNAPCTVEKNKYMLLKRQVKSMLRHYGQLAMEVFMRWAANGTLHEICFIGTTLCFAMATLLLCNTIMEIELARDGVHHRVPWTYVTWTELCSFFYTKQ